MSKFILEYTRNTLLESKEDQEKFKKWIGLDKVSGKTIGEIYFDKFLTYKQRIKSPYNDLYWWMKNSTPDKFKEYIDDLDIEVANKQNIKQKEKDGARLVYSDDDWKVYEITTYEASAKYGKGTKWCISGSKRWSNGERGEDYFDQYYNQKGIKFYYFINKDGNKWALAVYPGNSYCEIFNAEDVKVAFIPNAPQIDEIKVKYDDNSDKNILVNAIMSGQIDEKTILDLMGEVIYDNTECYTEIFNNPEELIYFLDANIPDGYLEHEAVENGDMTPEEYERITGEEYDDSWGGDLSQIDFNYDETGSAGYTSKEALLKPENFNNHKYWLCIQNSYDDLWSIDAADDYVRLYALCSDACNINDWDDGDVDDFYGDNDIEGASRADIFGIMIANQLIWNIKNGKISENVVSNLGLSKDFLNSLVSEDLDEELLEDRNEYFRNSVVRDSKGNLLPVYHCSFSDFDTFAIDQEDGTIDTNDWHGEFGFAWFTDDLDYARNYGDGTYEYKCYLNITRPLDIGEINGDVANYNGTRIKDSKSPSGYIHVTDDFINLCELVEVEPEKMILWYHKWNETGCLYDITRRAFFKNLVIKLGYDGVTATEGGHRTWGCTRPNQIKLVDNENPTDKDSMKEEVKKDKLSFWHCSVEDFDKFKNNVNWFTKDKEYARGYGLNNPIFYEVNLNCKNPMFVGNTDNLIYLPLPGQKKLGPDSLKVMKKLGLGENEFNELVDNLDEDFTKVKLFSLVRSDAFAQLVREKGYDCIYTIEQGHPCVGALNIDDIKIINKTNESLHEEYTPTAEDFPFTLKDVENMYPNLFSNDYKSCGPAFITSDGRFILAGSRFDTHADFAVQAFMEITDLEYEDIMEEWGYNEHEFLNAFTKYFDMIRVNDGSKEDVEDRAYFVIPKNRLTSGQLNSLESFIDYILDNKYSKKIYTLQAFVGPNKAHKLWNLGYTDETEDIIDEVKRAIIGGYFVEEKLEEDLEKDNVGYHAGDLGKSETYYQQSGGRGTGHFGTGTYFVGDPSKIEHYNERGGQPAPKHIVDFTPYKLYKPRNEEEGFELHSVLSEINNGKYYLFDTGIQDILEDYKKLKQYVEVSGYFSPDVSVLSRWKNNKNEVITLVNKLVDYVNKQNEEYYMNPELIPHLEEYDNEFDMVDNIERTLLKVLKENNFEKDLESYEDSKLIYNKLQKLFGSDYTKGLEAVKKTYNDYKKQGGWRNSFQKGWDSLSTVFMKALGFEGIDVRHLPKLDNTSYGSVIYDLKPDTIVEDLDDTKLNIKNIDNSLKESIIIHEEKISMTSKEYKTQMKKMSEEMSEQELIEARDFYKVKKEEIRNSTLDEDLRLFRKYSRLENWAHRVLCNKFHPEVYKDLLVESNNDKESRTLKWVDNMEI